MLPTNNKKTVPRDASFGSKLGKISGWHSDEIASWLLVPQCIHEWKSRRMALTARVNADNCCMDEMVNIVHRWTSECCILYTDVYVNIVLACKGMFWMGACVSVQYTESISWVWQYTWMPMIVQEWTLNLFHNINKSR